jgi:anti-sigma regulatory factor (Ser/Thr protein kinase)
MPSPGTAELATVYSRVFPGRTDRIREVRATLGLALAACPIAEDVVLAACELATNCVLHSRSREPWGRFTVRAELHAGDYLWLGVEDGGGLWTEQPRSDVRGRGLAIVAAVSSDWGVEGDALARVVWARFDWPGR